MKTNTFNTSTWVAEQAGILSWKPAWSTEQVPGLHSDTSSQEHKAKQQAEHPSLFHTFIPSGNCQRLDLISSEVLTAGLDHNPLQ